MSKDVSSLVRRQLTGHMKEKWHLGGLPGCYPRRFWIPPKGLGKGCSETWNAEQHWQRDCPKTASLLIGVKGPVTGTDI